MTNGETARSRLRQRPGVAVFAAVVVAIPFLFACWIAWSVVGGGFALKQAVSEARTGYEKEDAVQVEQAVASANDAMQRINRAVSSVPFKMAAAAPVVGASIGDVQKFAAAGTQLTEAGVEVAPSLDPGIYRDGEVNLAAVDKLLAALPQSAPNVAAARSEVESVSAAGPLGGLIGNAQQLGLAYLGIADFAVTKLAPQRAVVLDALGAASPQSYMIVFENPAALRAPGGAPFSGTILSFDKGKLTVPFNGYIGREAFDGHVPITYTPAAPLPWGEGATGRSFVSSGAHPDWRLAGEDLTRAWNAAKEPKVDAMIGMDTHAISALLAATGPIETAGYGTLTADNFAEKTVENAYVEFGPRQKARQSINDQIADAMVGRLLSGDVATLASAAAALATQTPGRHLQMRMQDPLLQALAEEEEAAGAVHQLPRSDTVGFFSRNRNISKVDVYSLRSMNVDVALGADGSAVVTQRLSVLNDAPEDFDRTVSKGYLTAVSGNEWFFYLPIGATAPSLQVPEGYAQPSTHPDGLGRVTMRTEGLIQAQETVELTFRYTLPAGTFKDAAGAIAYRNDLNPQPMQIAPTLEINVRAPDGLGCSGSDWSGGSTATWTGTQSIRQTVTLACN